MDTLQLLFNTVTVVFLATTMFAAGLTTTLPALRAVFATPLLPLLALLANLVVIPLLGWGIAVLFGLSAAAFIALVLAASSPGGPFGAKLSMLKNGDVVAGTVIQVLLAAVGSLTFGPTANGILTLAEVGGGVSLDVAKLVRTVAILQLVPFVVGLILRHYAPLTAQLWHHAAAKASTRDVHGRIGGHAAGQLADRRHAARLTHLAGGGRLGRRRVRRRHGAGDRTAAAPHHHGKRRGGA